MSKFDEIPKISTNFKKDRHIDLPGASHSARENVSCHTKSTPRARLAEALRLSRDIENRNLVISQNPQPKNPEGIFYWII